MMLRMKLGVLLAVLLSTFSTLAASLSDIQVANGSDKATVTLSFNGQPVYGFFPLHNPDRVVLDIRQDRNIRIAGDGRIEAILQMSQAA